VQERQFSPFDSENLTPAERRALRRARTRRSQAFALGVGASVLALFSVGCPGPADLTNPQDYPVSAAGTTSAAGTATTAGTGTGGGAPAGDPCETACIKEMFQTSPNVCKLCHNNMGLKSAMLDLASDGVTARLKNVPATHAELGTGMTAADCPTGDKLIDTATPANSWLLKKIRGEQGNCGGVMPAGGATPAQKTCVEAYVACVAPGGAAPSGGTSSGGTSSGGTSAGTSSGGSGGTGGA
jgi:hypothetical protein